MQKIRIAINGFGRIGRITFRKLLDHEHIEVVAINDLADVTTLAHLLKYDSTYGRFSKAVSVSENEGHLLVDNQCIRVLSEPQLMDLPWKELAVDIVVEATGKYVDHTSLSKHIAAGAQQVIVSAPAKDVPTVVLGINDHILATAGPIISNASCTTNCLAPLVQVLDQSFGIEKGFMTTIHAYTADQRLLDAPHKDLRRARAAAQAMIPTTTGAAKTIGVVLPHLQGKLDGIAVRVPVLDGSMVDFTAVLQQPATIALVNEAMKEAAVGKLKGILAYTEDPIVSVDVIGDPHSCVFDAGLTYAAGNLVKVMGWYDNEGGYAQRLVDLVCSKHFAGTRCYTS
jgi:glyceraldehyde 3-phosphate dehydrogenase